MGSEDKRLRMSKAWDFPGGPVGKTPRSQCAGDPGSIPGWGTRSRTHAATKSSHAATKKDPACQNEDPVCRN